MLHPVASSETTLDPKPGFVVKTKVLESAAISAGTKTFINVCHDPQVPRPPVDFEPAIVFPLIMENQWEIPLVVSGEKRSVDKKGIPAMVYDCCMNPQCFQWAQVNKDLRLILIEWCIEAVELLYDMTLERAYTTPKMLSKGDLSKTVIMAGEDMTGGDLEAKIDQMKRNETLGLIEEMKSLSDDEDKRPLPDLRNISNAPQKRPLIEEIPTASNEERTKKMDVKSVVKPVSEETVSIRQRYNFTVTFLKTEPSVGGESLEIAVECPQFVPDAVSALYDLNSRMVILRNHSQKYYFVNTTESNKDTVSIPVPPSSASSNRPHLRTLFQQTPPATLRVYV